MDSNCLIEVYNCSCGAITVKYYNEDMVECNASMPIELFHEHFPNEKVPNPNFYNCDYCVNRWGIDLCACGSGEKVDECDNECSDCGKPAQELNVPYVFKGWC